MLNAVAQGAVENNMDGEHKFFFASVMLAACVMVVFIVCLAFPAL